MAKNLEPPNSGRDPIPPGLASRRVALLVGGLLIAVVVGGLLSAGLSGLRAQQKQIGYDGMQGVPAPRTVISEGLSPPVGARFPRDMQPTPTLPANLPAPVVQTHNGYTVAVQPLAADANQVTISYTVSVDPSAASGADAVAIAAVALQDGTGATLMPLSPQWFAPLGESQRFVFDTGELNKLPADLSLQLSLTLEKLPPPDLPPPPPTGVILGAPPFTPAPTLPRIPLPTATPLPNPPRPTIGPPFQFALIVPTDRRVRVANVQQSVTASGIILTLEQVVVTNSETRLTVRGGVADDVRSTASAIDAELVAAGDQRGTMRLERPGMLNLDAAAVLSYRGSLLDNAQAWDLTVRDAKVMQGIPANLGSIVNGPWTFHFTVPPLAAP